MIEKKEEYQSGGRCMQSLAKVQAGESCEIKWMFGNADVMNFLGALESKEEAFSGSLDVCWMV